MGFDRRRLPLSPDDAGKLLALLAVILGAFIFFSQVAAAGFPINDGALFYTIIKALQVNAFHLPVYIEYNGLSIPLAYPPLGFYIGAAISSLFRVDPLLIVQWLPACILVVISGVVYFLGRRLLGSSIEAGLATFAFVCTPGAATSLIMGGGLTRGLGQLFLLLTVTSLHAFLHDRKLRNLAALTVSGSLVVLSHPEAALHAATACALLWLIEDRSLSGFLGLVEAGVGAAILTSAWWISALGRYGFAPFLSAGQTGLHTSIVFVYPFLLTFTEEPMMTAVAALGLVGCFVFLARKQYFLPAWLLLPFLVEPRGATTIATVPLSLMAAAALNQAVVPALSAERRAPDPERPAIWPFGTAVARWFLAFLAAYLVVMALYAGQQLAQTSITKSDRSALQWVSLHAPSGGTFLIMTGVDAVFCDPIQEWFPVLAGARSLTTIQGTEWTSNGQFFGRVASLQALQACLNSGSPLTCMEQRAGNLGTDFDYVYVARGSMTHRLCRSIAPDNRSALLTAQLEASDRYESVFVGDSAEIFKRGR